MMMLHVVIFTVCSLAFGMGQSAKYCGLKVTTTALLNKVTSAPNNDYDSHSLISTSIDSNKADSIIYKGTPITQQLPGNNGVFATSPQIIATFCVDPLGNKFLKSADVNGDDRDDLVCHDDTNGGFEVMLRTNTGYSTPEKFAHKEPAFICKDSNIVIGDFDGNNADDFLCITKSVSPNDPCSTYTIYFNQGCQTRHRESSHRHHEEHRSKVSYQPVSNNEYSIGRRLPYKYHGCNPNLPQSRKQTIALTCHADDFDIQASDINGDGKDDIVLLDGTSGQISYYLSNPSSLSAVFSTKLQSGIVCTIGRQLFVGDVDGDGDNDLICVGGDLAATSNANLPEVSFYSGNGFDAAVPFAASCLQPDFCVNTAIAIPLAVPFIGDFNNDGRVDVMCRYSDLFTGVITTEIVFAEPV